MIVKEPYRKRGLDGLDLFRVDDPSDVEFIDCNHIENNPTIFEAIILSIDAEFVGI